MSLASGSTGKRPRRRWRGVVEDFVDLNLKEHSYQCILKHTENLMKKLERTLNPDEMVKKGVIPGLVAILGHSDLHPRTTLLQTALRVLSMICEDCEDTDPHDLLVQAGAMPHMLKLLKLQSEDLAPYAVDLILGIMALEKKDTVYSQQEYIEALLAAVVCTDPDAKQSILCLIKDAVSDNMPTAEDIRQYISQLNVLLCDANPKVVNAAVEVYTEIANGGSDDVVHAMTSTGCLPLMTDILNKPLEDPSFSDSAAEARLFFSILYKRGHQ